MKVPDRARDFLPAENAESRRREKELSGRDEMFYTISSA
jgi:hypothetical protein